MPLVACADPAASSAHRGVSKNNLRDAFMEISGCGCKKYSRFTLGVRGDGTNRLPGLPKSQQASFDHFGFDTTQRGVAFFDAVAAFGIKLPLVFGAGQGGAFDRQLGDVGVLVRAVAVINLVTFLVTVNEQAAPLALGARDLA